MRTKSWLHLRIADRVDKRHAALGWSWAHRTPEERSVLCDALVRVALDEIRRSTGVVFLDRSDGAPGVES